MSWIEITPLLIFTLSAILLIAYYRFIFSKITYHSDKKSKELKPVSVIICAKNEYVNLKKNLLDVLQQDYPDFEVIVVNDNSTDGTDSYLEEVAKNHKRLRIVHFNEPKVSPGKKEALEYGILAAKHEQLLLTDADCIPCSQNWIKGMTAGLSETKDLVLGISLYTTNNSYASKFMRMDGIWIAIQYLSYNLIGSPYMSVGRNVCYTKNLHESTNGFSSHLHVASGDDDLFVQESATPNNTEIIINRISQTVSEAENNWKSYISQKSRHHSTGHKYKTLPLSLLGIFQVITLLFYLGFISCLLLTSFPIIVSSLFLLKNIVQATVFRRILVKIGVSDSILSFMFLDGVWVLFLSYINLKNLFRSNKAW